MRRYRFEAQQELITPLEVQADSEQQARERAILQDDHVTVFELQYGQLRLVLLSIDDD